MVKIFGLLPFLITSASFGYNPHLYLKIVLNCLYLKKHFEKIYAIKGKFLFTICPDLQFEVLQISSGLKSRVNRLVMKYEVLMEKV